MECNLTVTYSILINGAPTQAIHPSRGLRQGDLLLLYLFLLCSEGLYFLLHRATESKYFRGVSICKRGPQLTHLFFADDSLVFCKASPVYCQKIQDHLDCYEKAFGQKLNRNKTGLFFSKATPPNILDQIKTALGVQEIKQYERYLGLPFLVGKKKKASLLYIKERVATKLHGWKE